LRRLRVRQEIMRTPLLAVILVLLANITSLLAQDARLIVTVVDEFDRPLPDAQIEVRPEGQKRLVGTAVTDALGAAVIEVVPFKDYRVRATREGFMLWLRHPEGQAVWPVPGEVPVRLTMTVNDGIPLPLPVGTDPPPPQKGILSGRIMSATGEAVADTSVSVNGDNYRYFESTRTDADGFYRFALFPATYSITAGERIAPLRRRSSPVFVAYERITQVASAVVASRRATRVPDIVLRPVQLFNVTVTVVDEGGEVVSGADVLFTLRAGDGVGTGQFKTGSDGSLKLGPQLPGPVEILARAAKGERQLAAFASIELADAPMRVTLRLVPAAKVTGRVEFADQLTPLHGHGGLRVNHVGLDLVQPAMHSPDAVGLVNADGEFTVNVLGERCLFLQGLPQGWQLLDITYNGEDYTGKPFSFGEGEQFPGVLIRVERGQTSLEKPRCSH
jgi:hypothetical protein